MTRKQAREEVRAYAFYMHVYQMLSVSTIATLLAKSKRTITSWFKQYRESASFSRRTSQTMRRNFSEQQILWILDHFRKNPLSYLFEARYAFIETFKKSISLTWLCSILSLNGITRKVRIFYGSLFNLLTLFKVIERRARAIRLSSILNFARELDSLHWTPFNLVFLDEVSFNNRCCYRTRGYAPQGQQIAMSGNYQRGARLSMLCFINVWGVADTFTTPGTFTRKVFARCCSEFVRSGKAGKYPGRNSIWVLDCARIHCHERLVRWLRSQGVRVCETFFHVLGSSLHQFGNRLCFLPLTVPSTIPLRCSLGLLSVRCAASTLTTRFRT